jgi:HAD superfamily hydrolase (TIGR01549 family)
LNRIRAIGFDFDHTLGIDNKLERVAFLHLLDAICQSGGRCIGTLAEEIDGIDELLARQRSGAFTIDAAVERFAREHGAPEAAAYVEPYKRWALEMCDELVIPEPGVREMLAALAVRGVPCALLTNGWSPLQQKKASRVQFHGRVIASADIGVQKPEAGAFQVLANALDVPSAEIAYVGDSPSIDVAGAIRAGMQGVWFDAESVSYPKEIPAPAAVIHTLAELLAFV